MVLLSTGGVCCVVVGVGLTAVVMLGTRGVVLFCYYCFSFLNLLQEMRDGLVLGGVFC